jgi:outer membrane protein assembly factor BamB
MKIALRVAVAVILAAVTCCMAAEPLTKIVKDLPKGTEQPVGWRGNWTGKFLDAEPPLTWGKISKPMAGLRCQATKPKDDQPAGISASNGSLTEWMTVGPLPASGDAKAAIDEEFIKDEANCAAKEGDAINGVPWKKTTVPGSLVNFDSIYGKDIPKGTPTRNNSGTPPWEKPFVAYASTWVYSPAEVTFRFRVRAAGIVKIYMNGVSQNEALKILSQNNAYGGEFSCKLNKGWNHVLCKARNSVNGYVYNSSWYFDLGLRAIEPYTSTSEGIAWATLLPSYHIASPLIVGDKIFAMVKPADLVCMRKSDGKVLWIRSTTYYDLLTEKDKQSNPGFAKLVPLVAEINKIDAEYVETGKLTAETIRKRIDLHKQIVQTMAAVDAARFSGAIGHYPEANMPTPVSDGKQVYIWSELGIAVCYDLDGNRKWLTMPGARSSMELGCYCSPVLADGKMILFENNLERHKGGLIALDVHNGEAAWTLPDKTIGEPFMSLVPLKIGGDDCVLYGRRLVHGKDGKVLLENENDLVGHIPTPVIENGVLYGVICYYGDLFKSKLPTALTSTPMINECKVKMPFKAEGEAFISSPLYHDGLLYVVDQYGYLYVTDVNTQKVVYERELGLGKSWEFDFYIAPDWGWSSIYGSPIMAGKYIYVFGMNGTTVVLKPGREYVEVAKNKIEDCLLSAMYHSVGHEIPEFFASSPVAEGKRIYVRGGNYLYCIGAK